MTNDARCANDFQDAGPYANNGTLPLYSTLDNLGASFNFAFDLTETHHAQVDYRIPRNRIGPARAMPTTHRSRSCTPSTT